MARTYKRDSRGRFAGGGGGSSGGRGGRPKARMQERGRNRLTRDNAGKITGQGGSGATARGGRLKTAAGNQRGAVLMKAKSAGGRLRGGAGGGIKAANNIRPIGTSQAKNSIRPLSIKSRRNPLLARSKQKLRDYTNRLMRTARQYGLAQKAVRESAAGAEKAVDRRVKTPDYNRFMRGQKTMATLGRALARYKTPQNSIQPSPRPPRARRR